MIYLDTSALVKLVFTEPESLALRRWLADRSEEYKVTSDIGRVELMRVIVRVGDIDQAAEHTTSERIDTARELLDRLDTVSLTEPVVAIAESAGPATLRSLDALHLAAAMHLDTRLRRDARSGPEQVVVATYDHRLRAACDAAGLSTVAPGT